MKFLRRHKYIRAITVSLPISIFVAFTVWSVIDYITYYGGTYEQDVKKEIDVFNDRIRGVLGDNTNDRLSVQQALNYIQFPLVFDLAVFNKNNDLVYLYQDKQKWQNRCCEDFYKRSFYKKEIGDFTYEYRFYIIPKFSVSFLRAATISILPDYIYDASFSYEAWRQSFIHYFWLRSFVFYGMFSFSFIVFFVWSIKHLTYDEKREIIYARLSKETKHYEESAIALETLKERLAQINQEIMLKRKELTQSKDSLKQKNDPSGKIGFSDSIDKIKKEIAILNANRDRIEQEIASISEDIADESENIQDTQIDARIADIKVEFSRLFGAKMPNNLIDQISEGFYLYEQNPEYSSQIMHAWFNGFDYLVKKLAEPFWSRNKKHLLLGEAIKLIRKSYSPKQIDYYELKTVVNMRNRFSHFEKDILTIDNLRSLKTKLFGYKNTDGLFFKIVNIKSAK
ncbi:MAG: hypothetical protein LBP89_05315 [Helicobacteraceae bacterium]|jgi:hypothetical protein|nr:hypothetical protein [Helicobacteraceae bacterium]